MIKEITVEMCVQFLNEFFIVDNPYDQTINLCVDNEITPFHFSQFHYTLTLCVVTMGFLNRDDSIFLLFYVFSGLQDVLYRHLLQADGTFNFDAALFLVLNGGFYWEKDEGIYYFNVVLIDDTVWTPCYPGVFFIDEQTEFTYFVGFSAF